MRGSSSHAFSIGLLLTILIAASGPVHLQQPDRPRSSVTINTNPVVIRVQVTNGRDRKLINELEKDDFLLREDGNPQQISPVKEGEPLSVVILAWGLACAIIPPEWELPHIRESLRQLGDDAEIALMSYMSDIALVQPLTRDHNVIADVINKGSRLVGSWVAHKVWKQTGLHPGEAIYQAARYLEKEASPERRKIIIVLTYPGSNNKTHLHTAAEVSAVLEKNQTTVYALFREYVGHGFSVAES